jgi:hypothetical protein
MLQFFFGKSKNKRRHPRVEKQFPADWTAAPDQPPVGLLGLDMSASGVGVLSRDPIEPDEFLMRVKLDERVIPIQVKKMRTLPGTLQGRPAYRYGLEFSGISADDWDALVRWTKGEPVGEPTNKTQSDLQMVRMTSDDANRLMPKSLQDRLHSMLVRRGRLAPLDGSAQPLVQYFYGGLGNRGGYKVHRLVIVSRVVEPETGAREDFRTTFYFDEAGGRIEMVD